MVQIGKASGLQIAFFTFALLLLAAPLTQYLVKALGAEGQSRELLGKVLIFLPAGALIFGAPPLRRKAIAMLSVGIPAALRKEVVIVTVAKALLFGLAMGGALAVWEWHRGGLEQLYLRLDAETPGAVQMAHATSSLGILHLLLIACLLAPLLEELVFRGFLYRAWEQQWGVWPAMLLSSALFGLYHRNFFAAFGGAMIYVALARRTGSLWAPITAHATYNFAIWYPLMGQFIVPPSDAGIARWSLHLVMLTIAVVATAYYVWLASRSGGMQEAP